eukprot:3182831-Prymnesium_polylepis.1
MLAAAALAATLGFALPPSRSIAALASRRQHPLQMMAAADRRVVCIGETLFDGLPNGIFLGGAPLNVACHLAAMGVSASFISCVGRDRLGTEARRRLEAKGVDVSLVAVSDAAETGFVEVAVDEAGDASYSFITPAAWDYLPSAGVGDAAADADAVVFGSLAQRSADTRAAIAAARSAARCTVCDINLRP